MVKIRVAYETPEELEKVRQLLQPVISSCKIARRQSGPYKRAYINTTIGTPGKSVADKC